MSEVLVQVRSEVQDVTVHPGDLLKLCLPETPATGFLWARTTDLPSTLIEQGDTFSADSGLIGAVGLRCFTYRCEKAFAVTMTFVLRRPWLPMNVIKQAHVNLVCE
jgi:predicted secreted protein